MYHTELAEKEVKGSNTVLRIEFDKGIKKDFKLLISSELRGSRYCDCYLWIDNRSFDIDEETFTANSRPFVCFIHDEHNEAAGIEDCALCHHLYEDGKLVEDESSEELSCSECHKAKDDPRQLELTATYHKRCRGCHMKKKQGPVTCGECHKKTK